MKVFIISIFPISFLPPIITPFFGVVKRNIALQVILKFLTEVRHYFFIRFIYELSWYIMRYVENNSRLQSHTCSRVQKPLS